MVPAAWAPGLVRERDLDAWLGRGRAEDQGFKCRNQVFEYLDREGAGELVVRGIFSGDKGGYCTEEAISDEEDERGGPVNYSGIDDAVAGTVGFETVVARSGFAANGDLGSVRQFDCS